MRQGRLAGRYPAAASMAIFALVPYLALSAALQPLTPIIAHQLHMSIQAMTLGSGMANAAYAVGTVLAVQLAQHLPQRRMTVLYASLLVVGSILAAAAQNPGMFIAGRVLQGLCTSLLLIAAVPPAGARLRARQVPLDGSDHELVHFRRRGTWAHGRGDPGPGACLAAFVLDRRGDLADGVRLLAVDL
jgi:MFS family permease